MEQPSIRVELDNSTYVHPGANQMRHSLSRDSNLPEDRRSAATPSSSAYAHDIPTNYASLPPYNYSVPYDSSLPTPVSVAGSPSMNERSSKIMHPYNHHRASSQQPTPPNSSRPWSSYQMNAPCSQTGSPITMQAPDLLDLQGLEASHSPGDHGQMVPEHFSHQLGLYGVSGDGPPEEMTPQMTHPMYSLPSVAPTDLVRTMNGSHMSLPTPAQIPILHHSPDPRDLPPSVTEVDNIHHQFPQMVHHPHHFTVEYTHPSYRRRTARITKNRAPGRSSKKARTPNKRSNTDFVDPQLSSGNNDVSHTKPPRRSITLRPDAPEKDRFILELRCQKDSDKGKGIWEEITKQYEERYGKRRQESLQMNLSRAVLKYAVWPDFEDQALKLATEEWDRRRHAEIAKIMKEKYGGCQAWEWKEAHIAKRMVELGLEEFDPEDVTKKPRRKSKKAMNKHRPTGKQQQWGAPNATLPYEDTVYTLTTEQENYIISQYCKPEPDSPNLEALQGVLEHPSARGSPDHKYAGENQSERVAKQACEQLLAKGDHIYGAL
ncbi:hypothetical protein GGR53DRAFT_518916 [Hypoxylon sp. FL1150]|nr:hypothetical protein GGR53DRAFT_518916 [Hypoxylon sp. FL1150]